MKVLKTIFAWIGLFSVLGAAVLAFNFQDLASFVGEEVLAPPFIEECEKELKKMAKEGFDCRPVKGTCPQGTTPKGNCVKDNFL